jgi:hypothetical protein
MSADYVRRELSSFLLKETTLGQIRPDERALLTRLMDLSDDVPVDKNKISVALREFELFIQRRLVARRSTPRDQSTLRSIASAIKKIADAD